MTGSKAIGRLVSATENIQLKLCVVGFCASLACAMIFAFVSSQFVTMLFIVVAAAILVLGVWLLHGHSTRSSRRKVEAAWSALHQNTAVHLVTVIEKENVA